MQRILLVIGGTAVFCAVVTLLLQLAIARGLPVNELVLITALATLLLAVAATFLSYRAINRANDVWDELGRLSRSMDSAIKDLTARCDRDAAVLGEVSATVSRKLEALAAGHGSAKDKHNEESASVPSAAAKKGKQARKSTDEPSDTLDQPGVEIALRRAVSSEAADLALQPIIAAGRGAAGGFEVHLHVQPEDGKAVDIRRMPHTLADFDQAAFERLMIVTASEAARKRPADINDRIPLHVAISEALLHDGLEFAAVLDIFRLHPALARAIVLSLPATVAESADSLAPLEVITGLDVGLAVEGWDGTPESLSNIKQARCRLIKMPAARLLDRGTAKGAAPGADLIAMIADAGIEIIATDVGSDEDAVSLIDMGIDLMCGDRLSPPRRVKDDGHGPLGG